MTEKKPKEYDPTAVEWNVLVDHDRVKAWKRVAELEAALREILKGEGRFSHNQLEHANNTIEQMKGIATAALGEEGGDDVED